MRNVHSGAYYYRKGSILWEGEVGQEKQEKGGILNRVPSSQVFPASSICGSGLSTFGSSDIWDWIILWGGPSRAVCNV